MNKYTKRAEEYFKSKLSDYNYQTFHLTWNPNTTNKFWVKL